MATAPATTASGRSLATVFQREGAVLFAAAVVVVGDEGVELDADPPVGAAARLGGLPLVVVAHHVIFERVETVLRFGFFAHDQIAMPIATINAMISPMATPRSDCTLPSMPFLLLMCVTMVPAIAVPGTCLSRARRP